MNACFHFFMADFLNLRPIHTKEDNYKDVAFNNVKE